MDHEDEKDAFMPVEDEVGEAVGEAGRSTRTNTNTSAETKTSGVAAGGEHLLPVQRQQLMPSSDPMYRRQKGIPVDYVETQET